MDRYYFRYLLEIINTKLHIAWIIPWIIIALKYYLLKIILRPAGYDRGGAQIENNQWEIKNVTRRRLAAEPPGEKHTEFRYTYCLSFQLYAEALWYDYKKVQFESIWMSMILDICAVSLWYSLTKCGSLVVEEK